MSKNNVTVAANYFLKLRGSMGFIKILPLQYIIMKTLFLILPCSVFITGCHQIDQKPMPFAVKQELTEVTITDFDNSHDAMKVWQAIDKNVAPVQAAIINGRKTLIFPCNFAKTKISRCAWDCKTKLDLREVVAIQFDLLVENPSAIRSLNLYLKSGKGYYSIKVPVKEVKKDQWTHIRLPINELSIDSPGSGLRDITEIRFSPWARSDAREDASLQLTNFTLEKSTSPVVVVYSKDSNDVNHSKAALRYANDFQKNLAKAGLSLPVVENSDLTAGFLKDKKVIFLPYIYYMNEQHANVLIEYIKNGGKIIAAYKVPKGLAQLLGVKLKGLRIVKDKNTYLHFNSALPVGARNNSKLTAWGIYEGEPIAKKGKVTAWWQNPKDKRLAMPGVIVSENGVWLSQIPYDDKAGETAALWLSLASVYIPEIWQVPAMKNVTTMGRSVNETGWETAIRDVRELPGFNKESKKFLEIAQKRANEAKNSLANGNYIQAIHAAMMADSLLDQAYCASFSNNIPEFRGTFCHPPEGLSDRSWHETAKLLQKAGINNLFLNLLHGASAAYPSKYASYDLRTPEQKDYLTEASKACVSHNIKLHVWIMNFQCEGGHVSSTRLSELKKAHRLVVDSKGETLSVLCPSNNQNIQLQVNLMIEAASHPGVDGVLFDYIRYPNPQTCFCSHCQKEFSKRVKHKIKDWPKEVLQGGQYHEEWLQFRRDNITRLVRIVSKEFRQKFPQKKLSAAVWRNWKSCRNLLAQDWGIWVKEGLLDFICPMDYTANHAEFKELVEKQLQVVNGKIPVYPVIGLLRGHSSADCMKQIQVTRNLHTGGFVIWSIFPKYISIFQNIGIGSY